MSVNPTVDILVSDVIRWPRSEGRIHHRRHSLTESPEVFLPSADVPVNCILSDLTKADAAILHRRRQLLSTEDRSLPTLTYSEVSLGRPIFLATCHFDGFGSYPPNPEPGSFS